LLAGFRRLELLHGFPRWPFPADERGVVGRVSEGTEDRRTAGGPAARSARPRRGRDSLHRRGRGSLQRLELLLLLVGEHGGEPRVDLLLDLLQPLLLLRGELERVLLRGGKDLAGVGRGLGGRAEREGRAGGREGALELLTLRRGEQLVELLVNDLL